MAYPCQPTGLRGSAIENNKHTGPSLQNSFSEIWCRNKTEACIRCVLSYKQHEPPPPPPLCVWFRGLALRSKRSHGGVGHVSRSAWRGRKAPHEDAVNVVGGLERGRADVKLGEAGGLLQRCKVGHVAGGQGGVSKGPGRRKGHSQDARGEGLGAGRALGTRARASGRPLPPREGRGPPQPRPEQLPWRVTLHSRVTSTRHHHRRIARVP